MSSIVNQAAVKRYILQKVKSSRPHWKCTRVAGGVGEHYEAWLASTIRQFVRQPEVRPATANPVRLLVWSRLKDNLLTRFREAYPFLEIVGLDESVLLHIESCLADRIDRDIHQHPTLGQTFKVA